MTYCIGIASLAFRLIGSKIKVNGKRIIPSKFVKYLGIYIDNHLSWHQQENNMRTRLARAAGMLCKIRHYVSFETLRMVYFGIFSSILTYGAQIWGQHNRIVKSLQKLQNRAIRFMNFQPFRASAIPLFKSSSILTNYGSKSINARSIEIWNSINKTHHEQRFLDKSLAVCKDFITKLLLDKY